MVVVMVVMLITVVALHFSFPKVTSAFPHFHTLKSFPLTDKSMHVHGINFLDMPCFWRTSAKVMCGEEIECQSRGLIYRSVDSCGHVFFRCVFG